MNPMLRRRLEAGLWAGVILASIGLVVWGLWLTAFLFGYPDAFERDRSGHTLIFLGAIAAAAAARSWLAGNSGGRAPALLVGGTDLAAPDSLLLNGGGLIAVPAAIAGLFAGLPVVHPGREYREPLL